MAEFNEHESWDHWSVNLWISNDEPAYRMMQACICRNSRLSAAAEALLEQLMEYWPDGKTPDGGDLNLDTVESAMREDHELFWEEAE